MVVVFGDLLAEEDAGAVGGDGELGDPVGVFGGVAFALRCPLQAGKRRRRAGLLETTWVSPLLRSRS